VKGELKVKKRKKNQIKNRKIRRGRRRETIRSKRNVTYFMTIFIFSSKSSNSFCESETVGKENIVSYGFGTYFCSCTGFVIGHLDIELLLFCNRFCYKSMLQRSLLGDKSYEIMYCVLYFRWQAHGNVIMNLGVP
jgi:hypothetical protein